MECYGIASKVHPTTRVFRIGEIKRSMSEGVYSEIQSLAQTVDTAKASNKTSGQATAEIVEAGLPLTNVPPRKTGGHDSDGRLQVTIRMIVTQVPVSESSGACR